jgi:hypothetical protein
MSSALCSCGYALVAKNSRVGQRAVCPGCGGAAPRAAAPAARTRSGGVGFAVWCPACGARVRVRDWRDRGSAVCPGCDTEFDPTAAAPGKISSPAVARPRGAAAGPSDRPGTRPLAGKDLAQALIAAAVGALLAGAALIAVFLTSR